MRGMWFTVRSREFVRRVKDMFVNIMFVNIMFTNIKNVVYCT